jgi:hypothetical protein
MEQGLLHERNSVWFDRWRFEAAEAQQQISLVEAHKGLVVEVSHLIMNLAPSTSQEMGTLILK